MAYTPPLVQMVIQIRIKDKIFSDDTVKQLGFWKKRLTVVAKGVLKRTFFFHAKICKIRKKQIQQNSHRRGVNTKSKDSAWSLEILGIPRCQVLKATSPQNHVHLGVHMEKKKNERTCKIYDTLHCKWTEIKAPVHCIL